MGLRRLFQRNAGVLPGPFNSATKDDRIDHGSPPAWRWRLSFAAQGSSPRPREPRQQVLVSELVADHRLPAIFTPSAMTSAEVCMAYGTVFIDLILF